MPCASCTDIRMRWFVKLNFTNTETMLMPNFPGEDDSGPDSTRDEAVFGKHQAWLIIEVKLFFVRKVSKYKFYPAKFEATT